MTLVDSAIAAGLSLGSQLEVERARAASAARAIFLLAGEDALDAVLVAIRREAIVGHPPILISGDRP
jgi:hypothetical protein